MTQRQVILICYHFPPIGGPAIGRPLALVKHSPQFGYRCDVLTVKPVAHRVLEPELLDGMDRSRIFRAGSYDPQRLLYLAGLRRVRDSYVRGRDTFSERFFPDSQVGWVKSALRLGRTLASSTHYELIVSTSPPVSNHLVARQLALELNRPWIADFRDYWTRRIIEKSYRRRPTVERALKLLGNIRKEAAGLTAVSPSIARYIRADRVIRNCFDADHASLWRPPVNRDHFIIGILGTLDDICPIRPLLKVLSQLRQMYPSDYERVKLLQVGRVNENWLRRQVEEFRMTDRLDIKGFQKRAVSIRLLSAASLLHLAIGSDEDRGVIPGRLYTMLASGRPIMAAVPPGSDVGQLLAETGNACCYWTGGYTAAAEYLHERITAFRNDEQRITSLPPYAQGFTAESMTRQFARLFDELLAGQ